MNCAYHANNAAVVNCNGCGKPLCPACDHRIKGFPYCQNCIVEGVQMLRASSSSYVPFVKNKTSPFIALVLSFCPGLGQHNGQTSKLSFILQFHCPFSIGNFKRNGDVFLWCAWNVGFYGSRCMANSPNDSLGDYSGCCGRHNRAEICRKSEDVGNSFGDFRCHVFPAKYFTHQEFSESGTARFDNCFGCLSFTRLFIQEKK